MIVVCPGQVQRATHGAGTPETWFLTREVSGMATGR